jgi:LacI family transcriptional regulator
VSGDHGSSGVNAPVATADLSDLYPSGATLAEVGARAGVSTATVTRALRGDPRVRPETRARVEAAAAALAYVPHLGARALATRKSGTIGLLIPSGADLFWGGVTDGLGERAASAGLSMLLAVSQGDPGRERAMIELFLGKRVDGIVIGSATGSAWITQTRVALPIVLVNWDAALDPDMMAAAIADPIDRVLAAVHTLTATAPVAHVCTDDVDGAAEATRHLIALGHRRIAFAGLRPVRPSILRLLGVRSALADVGLEPAQVVDSAASLEGGLAAGRAILATTPRVTAVVAFDDMVALGVMRAAHAAGLRVPDELSVVGFDDVPVSAFVEPPLTTIGQDAAALGRLAVEVVVSGSDGVASDAMTVVRAHLVARQSTAPPPAA